MDLVLCNNFRFLASGETVVDAQKELHHGSNLLLCGKVAFVLDKFCCMEFIS
jgi:hypothetical protein